MNEENDEDETPDETENNGRSQGRRPTTRTEPSGTWYAEPVFQYNSTSSSTGQTETILQV